MKINRFIALAAIALLVVGAIGAVSMKVFAQSTAQTEACDQQGDDTTEVQDAPDNDNVELECGDQNEGGEEVESAHEQNAAPAGTPAISAEVAQKTAETYLNAGMATEVELENKDGKLVYSVEIGNTDVKVDAMSGEVLGVETGQD